MKERKIALMDGMPELYPDYLYTPKAESALVPSKTAELS